ncbi:MAG: exodeoxyribonuclease V subunit alpha [Methyloglobulus sp.]|nr:exodeoxyribonuclease V subunit alpha [Methyloglobulus sp.]
MEHDDTIFGRLDKAFARFLSQRTSFDNQNQKIFENLLATLSQKHHQGHSCIEITQADKQLLLDSGLARENVQNASEALPLIIEQNRLYLQRYWHYEDRLAKQIKLLSDTVYDSLNLESVLDRYFGTPTIDVDWQREAAKMAAQKAFCIITGGPGTGKTTTVCKILGLLQELSDKPLLIALAAPTGKAAMRLQEAIASNLEQLNCPENIKAQIPRATYTLHRLLGAKPPSPYFKHDAKTPLVFDLVVVDEASMVDLALMSKLVDALKPDARLILLGDKNQLASVEAGAVLADLIDALPSNTVELKQSYRFDDSIKKLADAVNRQDQETAWYILSDSQFPKILAQNHLIPYIIEQREHYLNLIKNGADFPDIYWEFSRFQVLCSNRYGKNGALELNIAIEQALFEQQLSRGTSSWYPGRPVMVLQNNPAHHLYNGDIGICLPDKDKNQDLMVFFERPDGTVKKYLPGRLPTCETALAMTIHKSQGSEFDDVLIILPDTINPVLSKELLYTAITRARQKITVVAEESVFAATLQKKIARLTGLSHKF